MSETVKNGSLIIGVGTNACSVGAEVVEVISFKLAIDAERTKG